MSAPTTAPVTIEQARAAKRTMEATMQAAVRAFEDATGFRVREVQAWHGADPVQDGLARLAIPSGARIRCVVDL